MTETPTFDQTHVVGTAVIVTTAPVTREMVDDLLTAAFEGGINYWCAKIAPRYNGEPGFPPGAHYSAEVLTRGGELDVYDGEDLEGDDEPKVHRLTLDAFTAAIGSYCSARATTPEVMYEDHDADTGDWLVQWAIFGEVVYG